MSKNACFIFLIFLVWVSLPGGAQETGEAANRSRTAAALGEWALSPGLTIEEHPLLETTGGFGASILARISGSEGKEGTFVLALPLYGDFAVDTGLAFISAALQRAPETDILAAFLGDERTSLPGDAGGLPHKGLRDLLSAMDIPENWVLCYLDIEDEPERILIRHGDGEYLAPMELVEPLARLSRLRNIRADFEIRYNEFHTLELAGRAPELALAWDAEINAVSLSSGPKTGTAAISPDVMAGLLLDYAVSLDFPVQNPDRHYNFFHIANQIIFVSEKASVQFLIGFMGNLILLTLAYFTRWRRRIFLRRFGLRFFFKYFWLFILFLPVLALILKGSGLFYGLIFSLLKKPVRQADYPGMILVILLGLALFVNLLRLPDFLRAIKGNFYGISALFFAVIGLFTAIVLDIAYAPIFVWITFFSFLGLLSARSLLVCITAFLIPFHALGALINLWGIGAQNLPDTLLGIREAGNWPVYFQLALILLPALLVFKKGIMIRKRQKHINPFILYALRFVFPALVVFSILIYALVLPGRGEPPLRHTMEDNGSLLTVSFDDTVFEESRILGLTITALYKPLRFDLILESDDSERPLVYSAPAPLEEQGEGILVLVLGEDPPNPFFTELVLSNDFSGFLRVEAFYTRAEGIEPEFNPFEERDYLLRLWTRRRIELPTSGNQGLRVFQN